MLFPLKNDRNRRSSERPWSRQQQFNLTALSRSILFQVGLRAADSLLGRSRKTALRETSPEPAEGPPQRKNGIGSIFPGGMTKEVRKVFRNHIFSDCSKQHFFELSSFPPCYRIFIFDELFINCKRSSRPVPTASKFTEFRGQNTYERDWPAGNSYCVRGLHTSRQADC